MARGDAARNTGYRIADTPVITPLPSPASLELEECCYDLTLLVEAGNPAVQDPLKNDKPSYFELYDLSINAASIILAKCVNGVEVDQVTIADNTYGTFKDFGVETHDGLNYISIKNVNWTLIFDTFGAGEYQFRVETNSIFSSTTTVPKKDFVYHLKEFTEERANTTVLIRSFNEGNFADYKNNGRTKFTYPDDWVDEKRIDAILWADKDSMEETYIAYNDGSEKPLDRSLSPIYTLETDGLPQNLREYLQFVVRMAYLVEITNHQNNNPTRHTNLPVQATGGFEPVYTKQYSKAKIEAMEFKNAFRDNFNNLLC